jgi:hypothetical protein
LQKIADSLLDSGVPALVFVFVFSGILIVSFAEFYYPRHRIVSEPIDPPNMLEDGVVFEEVLRRFSGRHLGQFAVPVKKPLNVTEGEYLKLSTCNEPSPTKESCPALQAFESATCQKGIRDSMSETWIVNGIDSGLPRGWSPYPSKPEPTLYEHVANPRKAKTFDE